MKTRCSESIAFSKTHFYNLLRSSGRAATGLRDQIVSLLYAERWNRRLSPPQHAEGGNITIQRLPEQLSAQLQRVKEALELCLHPHLPAATTAGWLNKLQGQGIFILHSEEKNSDEELACKATARLRMQTLEAKYRLLNKLVPDFSEAAFFSVPLRQRAHLCYCAGVLL